MKVEMHCDHVHRFVLNLTPEDNVIVPSYGQTDVLLTTVRVEHDNGDPTEPQQYNGSGLYLKRDGTPGRKQADMRWRPFSDLPDEVRREIKQKIYQNHH